MASGTAAGPWPLVARAIAAFVVVFLLRLTGSVLARDSWEFRNASFSAAGITLVMFSFAYWKGRRDRTRVEARPGPTS